MIASKKKIHQRNKELIGQFVLNGFFIILVVCCLYPLLLLLGVSFTSERALLSGGYRLVPREFSFYGYEFLFREASAIFRAYGVTAFASIVGTILTVLVTGMFAYPLSRSDFKLNRFFSLLVLFPMLFSAGVVPWYIVCTRVLYLKNTLGALFIPYLMNTWYVIIMRTFYKQSIPLSIIESARIDGAGEFRTFFSIVFPLAKAGLATIGFFSFITIWNDYRLPLYLISDLKKYNIQYLLWKLQSQIQFLSQVSGGSISEIAQQGIPGHSARMALCVLAVGPVIFAFPFFQRYFVKGLTLGAIKG